MVKKSLIWLYSFTTYLLWGVIIVVTSVVLGLRYYLLPHIKDYRETIAAHASTAVGQHITIGDIHADWNGLSPHFDLHNISVFDRAGRPALQFDHIEASLSWLSLVVGEPRLESLVIHQPRLTVRRETDGTIYVAGISMNGPSEPAFPNWLLRQQEIAVSDATVVWQDDLRQAPALSLEKLNLLIERPFSRSLLNYHRFGLTAVPSVGASKPIDLRGSVYGSDVAQTSKWHGKLYAEVEGTEIYAWRTWLPLPPTFIQGYGAMRLWLNFDKDAVQQTTADVALSNVVTRFNPDKPPLALQQISGRIEWQKQDADGFEFSASKLALSAEHGLNISNGSMGLQRASATTPTLGSLKVDTLALEPLLALADYLPIGDDNRRTLTELAPTGSLQNVYLQWQNKQDKLEKYVVRAGFNNLGIQPYAGTPGFSGLSGTLDADERSGKLRIDSRQAVLNLKDIFRQPIPADRLTAQVQWTTQPHPEIKISNLSIANPHLSGVINATYRADGIKGGYLDLTGDIRNADAKYASFYYPIALGKDTLHWLDTSIFKGRSDDVKVRVKGYLDDYPYIGGKTGEFSVTATIRDAFVDYANDWPKIEGLGLKMKFYENKMLLTEAQGRTLGMQIANTTVRINALDAEHPLLEIEGYAQGPVQEGLRFIEKSPIRDAINHFTDGMKGSGSSKLAIKLAIPVDNVNAARVNGSYTVANGTLEGESEWPTLDRINGKLDFTESTIKADRVQASVFGGPVSFNLASGANGRLDIRARGKITQAGLHQAFPHPLTDRLYGSADWRGQITSQNKRTDFTIEFPDLLGLASTLPYPFDKPSSTSMPLRIERKLTSDGDAIALTYGTADRAVSARLARSQKGGAMRLDKGDIRFGGEPHPASLARGITVGGALSHLDADQWLAVLDKGADKKPADSNGISVAKLKLGWLDLFGKRINDLQIDAKADGNNWKSTVKSREISGDIAWQPQGHGHIIARLDTLTFPDAAPSKLSESDEDSPQTQNYPAITLSANQFETRGKKLGKLELHTNQDGRNWNIESLRIENPDFTVDMSGVWQNWRRNASTRLNINMQAADLGKTLERFGYPGAIKDSTATLKGTLSWPESPHAFAPAALSGAFSLNVTKGQFLKIQPGVGRLLGILSLQNLPRRLLLDFRDVFSSGFAYDKISGDVRIAQGVMRSDNFVMDGTSAKVEISGETNLAKETQNLHVKVSPAVSDSVSLAAFAGGPVVGVAAFVAQKLLKDPLNKITSYEYDIVGTWDDPKEVKSESQPVVQPAAPFLEP
jgi:uncharacterized protein (TIGR02099 family)